MYESKDLKQNKEISENIGIGPSAEFENNHNLIGFFSILLEEALRTNPEKYLEGYKKNND